MNWFADLQHFLSVVELQNAMQTNIDDVTTTSAVATVALRKRARSSGESCWWMNLGAGRMTYHIYLFYVCCVRVQMLFVCGWQNPLDSYTNVLCNTMKSWWCLAWYMVWHSVWIAIASMRYALSSMWDHSYPFTKWTHRCHCCCCCSYLVCLLLWTGINTVMCFMPL